MANSALEDAMLNLAQWAVSAKTKYSVYYTRELQIGHAWHGEFKTQGFYICHPCLPLVCKIIGPNSHDKIGELGPIIMQTKGRQAYYHPDLQSGFVGDNFKRGTHFSEVCACFTNQT